MPLMQKGKMNIPRRRIVPAWIALYIFVLVIICMVGAFFVGSIIPGETAYHYKCMLRARKAPEKYSICATCGYWFSHKHMTMTALPNGYRWDCDECISRLEAYE